MVRASHGPVRRGEGREGHSEKAAGIGAFETKGTGIGSSYSWLLKSFIFHGEQNLGK